MALEKPAPVIKTSEPDAIRRHANGPNRRSDRGCGKLQSQMTAAKDPCANPTTKYSGLPSLTEWPDVAADGELWDRHFDRLRQARITAGDRISDVVETAIRAAAADSGAIEGLYSITAGVTRQVAEQRDDWRSALAEGGASAPVLFDAQLIAYHLAIQLA